MGDQSLAHPDEPAPAAPVFRIKRSASRLATYPKVLAQAPGQLAERLFRIKR